MSARLFVSNKNIDELSKKMENDSNKMSPKSRFGFFSINYSAYLGDKYYSRDKKRITDDQGKVISEKRGIYSNPAKKGKFTDSYFSADFLKTDKETLNRLKEVSENEQKAKLEKVHKEKQNKNFQIPFRSSGVQEYKDSLYPDNMKYKIPIFKESDKQKNCDFKERKVLTENRGVYSQPMKQGTVCMPGVLFEYQRENNDNIARKKKLNENDKKEYLNKRAKSAEKNKKMAFVPNNIVKCDTFQTNKELFAENPSKVKELLSESQVFRKEPKKRYQKSLPKSCIGHNEAFKPASLSKSVSIRFYLI